MKWSYEDIFRRLTDMSLLAVPPKDEISGCDSSTDPEAQYHPETDTYTGWGANWDNRGKRYKEGDDWVVFDREGPGIIWRIWSGSFMWGDIAIYIDDMETPVIDMGYKDFMDQPMFAVEDYNTPSLAPVNSRGRNRLVPIPFNKRCKIIFKNGVDWWFYHITYTLLPKGIELPPFNKKIDASLGYGLCETEHALFTRGEYPYARSCQDRVTKFSKKIGAGSKKTIFKDALPGEITCIKWDVSDIPADKRDAIMAGLKIKIYWDNKRKASVDAPFGALFASHPGYNYFKTYPMGMCNEFCYSYFYMPYMAAKIEIINENDEDITPVITIISKNVEAEKVSGLMRFCARYRLGGDWKGLDVKRFQKDGGDRWPDWPIIRLKGKGRFVGVAFHINNTWDDSNYPEIKWWEGDRLIDHHIGCHWWGEGDEKFFVDGEKYPSTFGTGSEDYIGFSFAANPPFVDFDSAYSAQSRTPFRTGSGRTSLVRFHIADNVPFYKSFDAFIEKYEPEKWNHGGLEGICEFATTVYWYEEV